MQKKSYQEFAGWLEEIDMSSPPHNPMTLTSLLAFLWYKNGANILYNFEKKIFLKDIRCDSTLTFHRFKQITWKWLTYSLSCMCQFHEFLSALYFFLQFTLNHGDDLVRTKYLPFLLLSKFELDLQFIQTPKLPISLFYFVPISYM